MVNNADYNSARQQAIREYKANPYAYHNPFDRKSEAWKGYDNGWMEAQYQEAQMHVKRRKDGNK